MLEVGEYVRTKKGDIDKIYEYKEDTKVYICEIKLIIDTQNMIATHMQDIVKHSKNIIDLIKVGDFVNQHKIIMDLQTSKKHYNTQNEFVTAVGYTFANDEIKSIVTKEQFANIEYKVNT